MTDEQRAERLHYHMYDSLEGIEDHAKRIVALEELVVNIWNVARLMDANRHIDGMRITEEFRRECEKAFKELGIEVE